MRALSATLLAAAAVLGAAQPKAAAGVTLVPPVKPTLAAAAKPTVKFVDPPANVSLNARDVPITVGFANVAEGEEVSLVLVERDRADGAGGDRRRTDGWLGR